MTFLYEGVRVSRHVRSRSEGGSLVIAKKVWSILGICVAVVLTGTITSVISSYTCLKETYFQIDSSKIAKSIRLVVLADLHNHEFGKNNQSLINRVREQKPDLVLMVGDILDAEAEDDSVAVNLVEALSNVAPVCFALGNQEIEFMKEHKDFLSHLVTAGGVVLEKSYQDIQVGSSVLRVGGMYGYAFQTEEGAVGTEDEEGFKFLKDFTNTDNFQILLFHRPESFVLGNASKLWNPDMVVSAHIHGGQVILPFVGGIYGAELGWFPEYTYGRYRLEDTELFLTRGLGSGGEALPRFNNIPEIMVVDLQ